MDEMMILLYSFQLIMQSFCRLSIVRLAIIKWQFGGVRPALMPALRRALRGDAAFIIALLKFQ